MARSPADLLVPGKPLTLAGVADGAEGLVLADLARAVAAPAKPAASLLVICRDGPRMDALSRSLAFFAPEIGIIEFPAWDCLPYDRVSPHQAVIAERMAALARLARPDAGSRPAVILTTVNAVLQRVPARSTVASQSFSAAPGNLLRMDDVMRWLELNGFLRGSTVREPGEYAVRGGIVDLFAPGMDAPVRLDFFGDTLESIRSFDPETQRTSGQLRKLELVAVAEFQLTPETIARFRKEYLARFGAARRDDLLYEAVSEGRRHPGMEHWLPLFHERLETLFDYLPGAAIVLEPLVDDAGGRAPGADRRLLRGAPRAARQPPRRRIIRCRPIASISPSVSGMVASTMPRSRGSRRFRCRTRALGRSRSAPARGAISRPSAPSPMPISTTPCGRTCSRCRAPASASPLRCGAKGRASA